MDQGHLDAHARRRKGAAHARIATAHNYQVIAIANGRLRQAQLFPTPIAQDVRRVRRHILLVLRKIEGVYPTIKAFGILNRQGRHRLGHRHRAAILPMPFRPFIAKDLLQHRVTHRHTKGTRRAFRTPTGHPILRAHVNMILTRRREGHHPRRMGHRRAQAMGQQIGRTHLMDKLGVQFPAPMIGKTLGLHQERSRVRRG